jgi:hypothetical protein
MILRNHGLLTAGTSIAEAFFNMYMLNKACDIQVKLIKLSSNNICFCRLQHFQEEFKIFFGLISKLKSLLNKQLLILILKELDKRNLMLY